MVPGFVAETLVSKALDIGVAHIQKSVQAKETRERRIDAFSIAFNLAGGKTQAELEVLGRLSNLTAFQRQVVRISALEPCRYDFEVDALRRELGPRNFETRSTVRFYCEYLETLQRHFHYQLGIYSPSNASIIAEAHAVRRDIEGVRAILIGLATTLAVYALGRPVTESLLDGQLTGMWDAVADDAIAVTLSAVAGVCAWNASRRPGQPD